VIAVRRDNREKEAIPFNALSQRVPEILQKIQESMFEEALKFQRENTHELFNYEDFKAVIEVKKGFIKTLWCGDPACEEKIKEETMATIRAVLMEKEEEKIQGKCVHCQKPSKFLVVFARAY
jgi:prolyl-tRNA synthetase